MSTMTKGERTELRSIVRQQFKVLRSELVQRQAEMLAQIEDEIGVHFAEEDQKWAALQHAVHEAVLACNRQINDAIYEHGYEARGSSERIWITEPRMQQPVGKRVEMHRKADARITAQVRAAQLTLDRREADLLRTLAIGALESEEAQRFVGQIPTVGELVPTTRLAELEESLADGEEPTR
jgi:hypothetical protein